MTARHHDEDASSLVAGQKGPPLAYRREGSRLIGAVAGLTSIIRSRKADIPTDD